MCVRAGLYADRLCITDELYVPLVLEQSPPRPAPDSFHSGLQDLYLAYARLEEEHGLARHAMAVYDRAVNHVAPEDKLEVCGPQLDSFCSLVELTCRCAMLAFAVTLS